MHSATIMKNLADKNKDNLKILEEIYEKIEEAALKGEYSVVIDDKSTSEGALRVTHLLKEYGYRIKCSMYEKGVPIVEIYWS